MDLLFGFSGRTNRSGWWFGMSAIFFWLACTILLGPAVAGFSVNDIATLAQNKTSDAGENILLFLLVILIPTLWIYAAVTIKRLHDRDKSGFWVLVSFVPYVGFFWQLIECGFLPGTPGGNQYGLPTKPAIGENWQERDYLQETAERFRSKSQRNGGYVQDGYGYEPIVDRNRKNRERQASDDRPASDRRGA